MAFVILRGQLEGAGVVKSWRGGRGYLEPSLGNGVAMGCRMLP